MALSISPSLSPSISPRGSQLYPVSGEELRSIDGSESVIQAPGRFVYDFWAPDGHEHIHEERVEEPNRLVQSREWFYSSTPGVTENTMKQQMDQLKFEAESSIRQAHDTMDRIRSTTFGPMHEFGQLSSLADRSLQEHRQRMNDTLRSVELHRSGMIY